MLHLAGFSQAARRRWRQAPDKEADKPALPPLPPPAHVQQQIALDGKTFKYTVTVGAIPVRDKDGKGAGDVYPPPTRSRARTGR